MLFDIQKIFATNQDNVMKLLLLAQFFYFYDESHLWYTNEKKFQAKYVSMNEQIKNFLI